MREEVLRLDDDHRHCWHPRSPSSFRCASHGHWRRLPAASGTVTTPAPTLTTPWGEARSAGHLDRRNRYAPCSARPSLRLQEFFYRGRASRIGPTASGHEGSRQIARSAGRWLTSPAPTMTCSLPRSAPARGRRGFVDPPNGRLPLLTPEAQEDGCCRARISSCPIASDRKPAKIKSRRVPGAGTILRPRRASRSSLRATTRRTINRYLRSGGRLVGGALPDGRVCRRLAPLGRSPIASASGESCRHPVASRCSTMWGQGPGVAAQYRHGREPAFACRHSPVVRRLAWALGGRYARNRRDEFQSEDRFSGVAREKSARGRALDADRTHDA